jgi:hypothetical protein
MTKSVDVETVRGWLAEGGYGLSGFRFVAL